MVRALLAGTKTQTRRPLYVVTKNFGSACFDRRYPPPLLDFDNPQHGPGEGFTLSNWRKAEPGDRLWVRETWARNENQLSDTRMDTSIVYRADGEQRALDNGCEKPWKPSIHMPRSVSRITLEVASVRIERLQAISEADAIAEGVERWHHGWQSYHQDTIPQGSPIDSYACLWKLINGPDSWAGNPWVIAITFRRL